jgi:hypothetical protein
VLLPRLPVLRGRRLLRRRGVVLSGRPLLRRSEGGEGRLLLLTLTP